MDLTPLKRLRGRIVAAMAARTSIPALAAGLGVLAIAAIADASRGLVAGWRGTALVVALCAAVAGIEALRRALRSTDLSLAGIARYATARSDTGRNAIASYLESQQTRALPDYVAHRLADAASREVAELVPARVVSLRPLVVALALAGVAAFALALPLARGYDARGRLLLLAADPIPVVALAGAGAEPAPVDIPDALVVRVTPPAYTGAATAILEHPSEISAVAGSRVEVLITPGISDVAATVSVNGAEPVHLTPASDGTLSAGFAAVTEGSIAVRSESPAGARANFLLPLSIRADRAPEVHITSPKGDVLVTAAARPASLAVEFDAVDDYGLGRARLVYIRSIGEGDSAEFVDGTLPVTLAASRDGAGTGRAVLDLNNLGVVAGATLVFHVEVEDRNTVTGPSTGMSESMVFEVAAPPPTTPITIGDLKPEELARFLVSERMILEHTLKLDAQRTKLARDEFLSRSTGIAQEQRDFKESFDQFIEIHDEGGHEHSPIAGFKNSKEYDKAAKEASAEATVDPKDATAKAAEAESHAVESVTEGHAHGAAETTALSDPAHELMLAVSSMWDAERSLGIGETDVAIPHERAAIDHLKRAQRAVRYFPRVKVQTKPVDLKRRYAGELADIRSRLERLERQELSPEEAGLRDALATVMALCRDASALDPESSAVDRAAALGTRADGESSALLALKTGYEPAVVAVAGRLANASASARRVAVALDSQDTSRARTAVAALNEDLFGAASQLGALLDRRRYVRGVSAEQPASAAARARSAAYSRRLAGANR